MDLFGTIVSSKDREVRQIKSLTDNNLYNYFIPSYHVPAAGLFLIREQERHMRGHWIKDIFSNSLYGLQ